MNSIYKIFFGVCFGVITIAASCCIAPLSHIDMVCVVFVCVILQLVLVDNPAWEKKKVSIIEWIQKK